jgi:hypothetical protein
MSSAKNDYSVGNKKKLDEIRRRGEDGFGL